MKKKSPEVQKERDSWETVSSLPPATTASREYLGQIVANSFTEAEPSRPMVDFNVTASRGLPYVAMESLEKEKKQERLDVRVTRSVKDLLERTAQLRGLSLSAYVTEVTTRDALQDLERRAVIKLSERDSRRLLELLVNPREPNDALKRAAENYYEDVEEIM